MTRGTGYIITNKRIYFHDEFNGDMYRENGHGESFIKMLDKTTPRTFGDCLNGWNQEHHAYQGFNTYNNNLPDWKPITADGRTLDFTDDYFKWWFSDWIFIKNMTKGIMTVICDDGIMTIPKNYTYAFYFGRIEDGYKINNGKIIQCTDKDW